MQPHLSLRGGPHRAHCGSSEQCSRSAVRCDCLAAYNAAPSLIASSSNKEVYNATQALLRREAEVRRRFQAAQDELRDTEMSLAIIRKNMSRLRTHETPSLRENKPALEAYETAAKCVVLSVALIALSLTIATGTLCRQTLSG